MIPFRIHPTPLLVLACLTPGTSREIPANLDRERLVPWCIVPFDAIKRTPAERAEMLQRLGLKRSAYDWRAVHVPEFEEEIRQYERHGIGFFAFWGGHESAFALFEKYDLKPQVWRTLQSPKSGSQDEKVKAAAHSMEKLAKRTAGLGCPLAGANPKILTLGQGEHEVTMLDVLIASEAILSGR